MVIPDGHLDPLQYLHHLIFRIAANVWIGCGTTDHNRTIKHTAKEPVLATNGKLVILEVGVLKGWFRIRAW
jgi:hypothetical protein